jgi:parvulin-like peptidyl-prolyl isomerase
MNHRIRASHILIKFSGARRSFSSRSRDDAQAMAADLKAQLDAGGDFRSLARSHSECSSSERGGDLGKFGKGQMAPEFEQAAFALAYTQISDVVESPFGFHIIQRTG